MAMPHYNYYPPAGQVIDASDGRVTWDGQSVEAERQGLRRPVVAPAHRQAGQSMSGWYLRLEQARVDGAERAEAARPRRRGRRSQPAVAAEPAAPAPVTARPAIVARRARTSTNPIESLMKHPIAPVRRRRARRCVVSDRRAEPPHDPGRTAGGDGEAVDDGLQPEPAALSAPHGSLQGPRHGAARLRVGADDHGRLPKPSTHASQSSIRRCTRRRSRRIARCDRRPTSDQ